MSENPPAFPTFGSVAHNSDWQTEHGMTLRDYLAGQALSNPALCTGTAPEWQLKSWFGDRGGLHPQEIAAKQCYAFADAMLAQREPK